MKSNQKNLFLLDPNISRIPYFSFSSSSQSHSITFPTYRICEMLWSILYIVVYTDYMKRTMQTYNSRNNFNSNDNFWPNSFRPLLRRNGQCSPYTTKCRKLLKGPLCFHAAIDRFSVYLVLIKQRIDQDGLMLSINTDLPFLLYLFKSNSMHACIVIFINHIPTPSVQDWA